MRARRVVAGGAVLAAVVAVTLVLFGVGSSSRELSARFVNASQLVKGSPVRIAGEKVGSVQHIGITQDGMADVKMKLNSDVKLHQGTRAEIRSLGLSGVANRFVELQPGPPTTGEIPDGGSIGSDRTRGVVDLDALLDSFDGPARRDIRTIFAQTAQALTPKVARQTNAGLHLLNPAVAQTTALLREVTNDEPALRSLIHHASSVSASLADQRDALGSSIDTTSGVLSAVASQRDQLAAGLEGAPAAMGAATHTLRRLRTVTLPLGARVAEEAEPGLTPVRRLLEITRPTIADTLPTARAIRRLLPATRRALLPLPALTNRARPAVASTTKSLLGVLPVAAGLRPYTPELASGFFDGFGGAEAHSYDANGHYLRISLQLAPAAISGIIARPSSGQLGGLRTGLVARCPGGAEESAPDRSNPLPVAGICNPKDDK